MAEHLSIDSSSHPRAYCISGKEQDSALVGAMAMAAIGVGMMAGSYHGVSWAFDLLAPDTGDSLGILVWCIIQVVYGTFALAALALGIGGLLLVLMAPLYLLPPGTTTWRLDGSGIYAISGVGRFRQTRTRFIPFEAIAEISSYKSSISLFVWERGRREFECALASSLSLEEAQQMMAMLRDDFTAARVEWEAQGLVAHPRSVALHG